MILSIITINRNNASGLEKTLRSVASQTFTDFEYIIIDGASTDGSVEIVKCYENQFGTRLKWISEPDAGIYNAMNKGIGMADGDYLEFLNSGDSLASDDVVREISNAVEALGNPSILYGNLLKDIPGKRIVRDRGFAGERISFLGLYSGTLNHSSSFIRKELFDRYGLYDESLRIVSDWEWFVRAIALGDEKPVYVDIDVSIFDMTGISETNKDLTRTERQQVLSGLIPQSILTDYREWAFPISRMKRLKRHPWAYKLVWFLERCLFKMEKNKR